MDQSSTNTAKAPLIGSGTLKDAVRSYERALILESLKVNEYDKRKVAKLLGISISSLYRKLAELSLDEEKLEVTPREVA
jgi:transcriptional regulator with PAS, ATPase and Fis domain